MAAERRVRAIRRKFTSQPGTGGTSEWPEAEGTPRRGRSEPPLAQPGDDNARSQSLATSSRQVALPNCGLALPQSTRSGAQARTPSNFRRSAAIAREGLVPALAAHSRQTGQRLLS